MTELIDCKKCGKTLGVRKGRWYGSLQISIGLDYYCMECHKSKEKKK